jgi:hypothetical protein
MPPPPPTIAMATRSTIHDLPRTYTQHGNDDRHNQCKVPLTPRGATPSTFAQVRHYALTSSRERFCEANVSRRRCYLIG